MDDVFSGFNKFLINDPETTKEEIDDNYGDRNLS